jgi:hypothetical protein
MTEPSHVEERIMQRLAYQTPIAVDFIGSAGAGKSTYLSAVHRVLGYGLRGIKIERDVHQDWRAGKIIGNSMRGINRTNATHASCDSLQIYGWTPEGTIALTFFAPGGHRDSVLPEQQTSASVYFLDLELLNRARDVVKQDSNFEFFPFKDNGGSFFGIKDRLCVIGEGVGGHKPVELKSPLLRRIKEAYNEAKSKPELWADPDKNHLRDVRYAACRAFALELFKEDELGIVIETLLDAQLKLEARIGAGLPIVGIQTYDSRMQRKLETTEIIQEAMNTLLERYKAYIESNGFPYKKNNYFHFPAHASHNDEVAQLDITNVAEWYALDSYPRAHMNDEIIKVAHSVSSKALRKKGIDASRFKLIRFTKRNLEDTLTIHLDELI